MTDNKAGMAGWVLYDGDCRLCCASAHRFRAILARRRFQLLPLQSPDAQRLGLNGAALLAEMRLLLTDGTNVGGADAIVAIARRIWWVWPLWLFSHLPGVMPLLRTGYRVLAANRNCINGACMVTRGPRAFDWLPLLLLPVIALIFRNRMADWVFMWAISFAIFFGCKWLTLRRAHIGHNSPVRLPALAYLFLWPGMDARGFFTRRADGPPALPKWLGAITKTIIGAIILWLTVTRTLFHHDLLNGWLGLIGIILMLHFGSFHLLALAWRANGRDVEPIMRAPLLSKNLSAFWSNGWNTGFNALAHEFIFRPLVKSFGPARTTLLVFLISGIIHDLVISVPARGGYGLPTAYFLLQGLGVLFERSYFGKALGLGRGWRGRTFMLLLTGGPVFWLFHPPFIHNVILPMLRALGTTLNLS